MAEDLCRASTKYIESRKFMSKASHIYSVVDEIYPAASATYAGAYLP